MGRVGRCGGMVERFLPPHDPVAADVLEWTVSRDARDIRQLLEWLLESDSRRERLALMGRTRALFEELGEALDALEELR